MELSSAEIKQKHMWLEIQFVNQGAKLQHNYLINRVSKNDSLGSSKYIIKLITTLNSYR